DGDALTREVMFVLPPSRMEHRARERVASGHVGKTWLTERSGSEDEQASRHVVSTRGDAPAAACLIPHRAGELVVEADVREDAEATCALAQVFPDLRLPGICARPGGLSRQGERVQVTAHVTQAARSRRGGPRATD